MKKFGIALGTLTLVGLFGMTACGTAADKKPAAEQPAAQSSSPGAASSPAAGSPQTLKVATVDGFSSFVTNAKGRTIYRFDKDTNNPAKTTCFDACAETWQPVLAGPGGAFELDGVDKTLVSAIDRPEGKQLTLKGWPLYYYKDDKALGQTAGHGKGGVWFAISPDGSKASTTGAKKSY
ncbi:COG4315 family predicted lipoprotein [Longispora albida]|uniref:COG4315 family predicted lipoprotein n=1 Tax=Longispora albida TaxID=203523 RepID=UPI00036CCE84|nr:hypothetical protein [Longispora albida]